MRFNFFLLFFKPFFYDTERFHVISDFICNFIGIIEVMQRHSNLSLPFFAIILFKNEVALLFVI